MILHSWKQALLAAIPNAKSDHLAVVVAFDAWQRAGETGGRGAAATFCSQHFISHQARAILRRWVWLTGRKPPAARATQLALAAPHQLSDEEKRPERPHTLQQHCMCCRQ